MLLNTCRAFTVCANFTTLNRRLPGGWGSRGPGGGLMDGSRSGQFAQDSAAGDPAMAG